MNINKTILQLFILVSLAVGCTSDFEQSKMVGQWKVTTWVKTKDNTQINAQMDMTFNQDGTYQIDYGEEKERGKYWLSGEFLHTVEEGQSEKKVKIELLQNDSLKIQMNRSGSLESVLLQKRAN